MQLPIETKKEFSFVKRVKSFSHAGRGLKVVFKTTHKAWIHGIIFICAILLGVDFSITSTEWIELLLAAGLVFTAEAFNTAIEIDIDLTSPDYHPSARDTKDVAAGAVLISAVIALVVGLIIFVPHFIFF